MYLSFTFFIQEEEEEGGEGEDISALEAVLKLKLSFWKCRRKSYISVIQ